jgi:hypothetical protein
MEVATVIGTRDLKALFRAQGVIRQLVAEGLAVVPSLEPAITMARQRLETRNGRRRYLLDMLPDSVAHALPGVSGRFVVELCQAGCIELQDGIPVLFQVLDLERCRGERAVRLLHSTGIGFKEREYWL